MNIKNVAVGLAGVGIIGAIALGNSVAFADDSSSTTQAPITSSTTADAPMGHRGHHHLATAAEFLGLTEEALMAELQTGKTLAEVAEAQGKSVQGLIDVLVAEATTKITDMVNNPLPAKPEGFDHRGGHHSEDYDYSGEELSEDSSSL
jgi:hypothetical protein